MFGPIDWVSEAIFWLAWIACVTDVWKGKIYNPLTFTGMILGLSYSFFYSGFFLDSLLSIGVAFFLLIWFFQGGILGAGDVKLLMAFGAWVGASEVVEMALLSLFLGGVFSLFLLLFSGQLLDFLKRALYFCSMLWLGKGTRGMISWNPSSKMPFGVPLALAACLTHSFHPLVQWGLWR